MSTSSDELQASPTNVFVSKTFQVPFTHRLLFSSDILGSETDLLFDMFEHPEDQLPKVQVWIDRGLAGDDSEIETRLRKLFAENHARARLTGIHTVVGGEEIKNDWRHVETIISAMNAANLDRRSYVIVVGGGAVLDAVGFAAATAHRGIRLIRLPTTTLGQADSGIGVKNAVNRFGKKNWLGTFAVPWAVINDSELLSSLSPRAFRAGFSEAVKVTLLKSPEGFRDIELHAKEIHQRSPGPSQRIIRLSAELHFQHITEGGDPFEALEARPLDFGHWSAHRLESMTNFELPHGEAVGIGVALDAVYSSLSHGLPMADASRILKTLSNLGLPLFHPALDDRKNLFDGLEEFRQHLGGKLTLTMLSSIGKPIECHSIDREKMEIAIDTVKNFAASETSVEGFDRAA